MAPEKWPKTDPQNYGKTLLQVKSLISYRCERISVSWGICACVSAQ